MGGVNKVLERRNHTDQDECRLKRKMANHCGFKMAHRMQM